MLGRFAQTGSSSGIPGDAEDGSPDGLSSVQAAVVCLLTGFAVDLLLPQSYDNVAMLLHWAALLLSAPPILRSAVHGLADGHAHVDELVAIAIVAALAAGFVLDTPFVDEAASVAVIMRLGSLIEEWASSTAHRSIRGLEALLPRTVRRVADDGQVSEVDIDDLRVGDMVLVRPGDRVGADGRITEGEGSLNQAAVTGESLPVDRGIGDEVFAGSVNQGSAFKMKVAHVRGDTTIGRITRMISDGEAYQPHIVRTADMFFVYYTPVILVLALLTYLLSTGPEAHQRIAAASAAIAVLVVGCPCPLILSSPIAIMCGLSRAARAGIAIKAGAFLEGVGQIRTVVFDKTGTLTTGQIRITAVDAVTVPDRSEGDAARAADEILRLTATVEVRSNHPLAQAVVKEAKRRGLTLGEPTAFSQVGGLGIRGEAEGRRLVAGSRRLMENEMGAEAFAAQRKTLAVPADDPSLLVFVMLDGKLAGCIRMEDTVREDAAGVLAQLRGLGVERLVLLTGDRKEVAERVARAVGITEVAADLLPQDKIDAIRRLQQGGRKVAMVGDGVNDAPALMAADVGIAVGDTATEVALEASNAAILSGSLRPLPFFFSVSRATAGTIYWNLFMATAFNVVALALTASGQVGPTPAAVLHVIATGAVILNSLALNKHAIPEGRPLPVAGAGGPPIVPPTSGGSGGGSSTPARRSDDIGPTLSFSRA